jgi:hypothetical protein
MNFQASLGAAFALTTLMAGTALAQVDPGVRGGLQNTGGGLQAQGKKIPHPPLISPHPVIGATVDPNEKLSFYEGIGRAGQLESTCDQCAMVTPGSPAPVNPVNGLKEMDPLFPQFTTNSNGLGAATTQTNASLVMPAHAWWIRWFSRAQSG